MPDPSLLSSSQISSVMLAYEPVWAIGTGKVATAQIAEEAHLFCRQEIEEKWGREISSKIPILYGGSVKPENAKDLLHQRNIDGFLIGGAALVPESFLQVILLASSLDFK